MRLMDVRYRGLTPQQLAKWIARKEKNGKNPELFGWFDGESDDPQRMLQVMAITSQGIRNGHRVDPAFSMLGVAADLIPEAERTEEQIRIWLARFAVGMQKFCGLGTIVRAVHQKTMTWEPMHRLHVMLQEGIYIRCDDAGDDVLYSSVISEQDLGAIAYWQMRTIRVPAAASSSHADSSPSD